MCVHVCIYIYTITYDTCAVSLSHVQLSATLRTVARQDPLFTGFSRKEYWSGLPRPPPEDRPNTGIEHRSPTLQMDSLPSEPPGKPTFDHILHI